MINCEVCSLPKTDSHRCPPKWIIYIAGEPETKQIIHDHNPDIAAEMFLDTLDEEDKYHIADEGIKLIVENTSGKRFEFESRYVETVEWFVEMVY